MEKRTQELLQHTIDTAGTIDMMRDYWYGMKDDAELKRYRTDEDDEKWSDKVTAIIRSYIEKIALNGNPGIYKHIGLESRMLNVGEAPIVVIFEKQKKEALSIVNRFNAGYAFSRGQFPTFEASFVAAYLEECKYSMGYVFVLTDYDPAGEHLFNQVKRKMDKFTTDTQITTIHVKFGENALDEFETYTLTENSLNKKWISEGRTEGIEFNTPNNISNGILSYLTESIMENVDPRIFVDISYRRWLNREILNMRDDDNYYTGLKESIRETEHKIAWRELRHEQRAILMRSYFFYETPARYSTYRESDTEKNSAEDMEFYSMLLGDKNPHSEQYRKEMVKKTGQQQWWL